MVASSKPSGKMQAEEKSNIKAAIQCAEFTRDTLGRTEITFNTFGDMHNACTWLDAIIGNLKKELEALK